MPSTYWYELITHNSIPPSVPNATGWPVYRNVKTMFGAKGDGVTDDTKALQNAINAGVYVLAKPIQFFIGMILMACQLANVRFNMPVMPSESTVHVEIAMPEAGSGLIIEDSFFRGGVVSQLRMFFLTNNLQAVRYWKLTWPENPPGAIGFWNTHLRVGGAFDTRIQKKYGPGMTNDPAQCKSAFMLAHFNISSSAYVDNMWAWTADHDLDGLGNPRTNPQCISTGRGVLIESTKPSCVSSEHNTLYQVSIHGADNIFIGFQQSETPYWQGGNSTPTLPDPWAPLALPSDPDFQWCEPEDVHLSLFAGGFWTFFNDNKACANGVECQRDAI
ncbi:hypothetical protein F4818DRAFT_436363 [Hypoxylon cercidicola]|nr:hypothetical protein F4818DRAFT_436363 [Hypoxylon cercidicola]